jgi:hypothetical protein
MMEVRYKGLRIEPTLAATRELLKYNKDLTDVLEILTEGYDCGASKRKPNILEKCIKKDVKEFKAVVAKITVTYPDGYTEHVWRLIHFGMTTFKKR